MRSTPPFFIVGCGRSGTTLLRVMLNRHPLLAIPTESLFIVDYLRAEPTISAARLRWLLTKEKEIAEWGLKITEEDLAGAATARDMIDTVHAIYAALHGKSIWGQKTPRFVRYGSLLKHAYPEARFIHLIRDPRSVVSSLMRSNVHRSNPYFGSHRWLADVGSGLELKRAYPDDTLEIRFEELVSNPQETLEAVCGFLGIGFEPKMLESTRTTPAEYGRYYAQVHSDVGRAPDPGPIALWRSHLSARHVSVIEQICGDMMRTLGYAPESDRPGVDRPYLWYLRLERAVGLLRQAAHYLMYRPGYLVSHLRRQVGLSLLFRGMENPNF